MASPTPFPTPTAESANALFKAVEQRFPSSIGDDKWYLVVLAAISYCEPNHAATLYTYLISKPEFTTPSSRQALVRRLREALVKNVSIIGVVKPLQAILCVAEVEREEDRDQSFSRENWQCNPENAERGSNWLHAIYQKNRDKTLGSMANHKDFSWISTNITYGLYLSDHSILSGLDTEMVVVSAILIQNMPLQAGWHLRGTRRLGVSMEDVETIHQCVEMIAEWGGVPIDRVPRVKDIEHEV